MTIWFILLISAYIATMELSHGMQIPEAKNEDTVVTIKTKIQGKEGIPTEQRNLSLFDGKQLEEDEKHLANYEIKKESTRYSY